MRTSRIAAAAYLVLSLLPAGGCKRDGPVSLNNRKFAVTLKTFEGRAVARGTLLFHRILGSYDEFEGRSAFEIPAVPKKPKTVVDYGLITLSNTFGTFKGRTVDTGQLHIALQPEDEKDALYLEGRQKEARIEGFWYHKSDIGVVRCGPFEAELTQ